MILRNTTYKTHRQKIKSENDACTPLKSSNTTCHIRQVFIVMSHNAPKKEKIPFWIMHPTTQLGMLSKTDNMNFKYSTQYYISVHIFSGMTISSSFWGTLADKYGRRPTLIWTSVFLCYFGLMTAFSPSFNWVLFLRFLVGFFIGGVPQVSIVQYTQTSI